VNGKLFKRIDRLIDLWCILLMSAMTITVILSVFCRYVLSIAYVWSEELITMLFIGASFFGCVLAVKERAHIVVDILLEKLPRRARRVADIMISLLNVFVQTVLIDASVAWIDAAGSSLTPGMRLPAYLFYSFLPITSALIILYEIVGIKDLLTGKQEGGHIHEHVDSVS
jgi:TRAP-type C4-dicarboxylate transport system permease small subunit